jgi:hypothetical protein
MDLIVEGKSAELVAAAEKFNYSGLPSDQRQCGAEFARLAQKLIFMYPDGEQLVIVLSALASARDEAMEYVVEMEMAKRAIR